jgi:DNA-binding response OmpR family regulator
LARVLALVRRVYSAPVTFTPTIRIGELEIDVLNRTVRTGISERHLTSLEQSVLYLLAANAGRVVTREEILDALWGTDYVAESNVVDRQHTSRRQRRQLPGRRTRDRWAAGTRAAREGHLCAQHPDEACREPLPASQVQRVAGGRYVTQSDLLL